MEIKIFHTGDIHIGMRFNKYPEEVMNTLRQARIDVIENMVDIANKNGCNLFVIAGDLFDKTTGIDKKTIGLVAKHLNLLVTVLPFYQATMIFKMKWLICGKHLMN
jgi:DNA repair exonuclease SbcCD nuclease subunit